MIHRLEILPQDLRDVSSQVSHIGIKNTRKVCKATEGQDKEVELQHQPPLCLGLMGLEVSPELVKSFHGN